MVNTELSISKLLTKLKTFKVFNTKGPKVIGDLHLIVKKNNYLLLKTIPEILLNQIVNKYIFNYIFEFVIVEIVTIIKAGSQYHRQMTYQHPIELL